VLNVLVLLFQLLLEPLNVSFEGFFALLVLALKCQNLIVSLRCLARGGETLLIRRPRVLSQLLDGVLHSFDAVLRKLKLATQAINFDVQIFVVSLDIVEEHFFMLKFVLERLEKSLFLVLRPDLIRFRVQSSYRAGPLLVLIGSVGRWLRLCLTIVLLLDLSNLLINLRLDLQQLILRLLVIIVQNHELFALVLHVFRVVVGFLLKAHRLSLVQSGPRSDELLIRMVLLHHVALRLFL